MGQIIKSLPFVCLSFCLSFCLSVCLAVCHLSYGRNCHSIFMKLYTIDWNPNSKNPLVGGQNPTIPSPIFTSFFTPIMHCQWQGLSTTASNHVDRLWRLIAQRTLVGGRYTGRDVSQTSHVGGGGTSSPSPPHSLSLLFNPSFPPSTAHPPLLFPCLPSSSLPSLPSPSPPFPPPPLRSRPAYCS